MKRFSRKADDNQATIVAALREQGCFVQPMSAVGQGVPDLLVGYQGYWNVLEVKDGDKTISKRKLTVAQQDWLLRVQNRAPVYVVETVEDAIEAINNHPRPAWCGQCDGNLAVCGQQRAGRL